MNTSTACNLVVYWWDGEYEDNCIRSDGHDGDHWDGLSWFNDDREPTDYDHAEDETPVDVVEEKNTKPKGTDK